MNILFVCTGNTCRSPMAEAILKAKNLDNVNVKSAGIYAMDGENMSLNSQKVLMDNNIPFTHKSSSLQPSIVEWADLILTMTAAHKKALIFAFPEAISKIYMYKEFATPDDIQDVMDPFGGNLGIYERTYEELSELTEGLVKRLQGEKG